MQHRLNNISLFTHFSGIKTHFIQISSDKHSLSFCENCPNSCHFKGENLQQKLSNIGLTYFCPADFCFMYVPFFNENEIVGYHITDPIFCKNNEHCYTKGIVSLSLSQISKASRLLFELTVNKRTYLPIDHLFHQLSLSVTEYKPENAQKILNHIIEELITTTAGDYQLIKTYTIHFILMIYELIEERHDVTKPLYTAPFQGHRLSCAETIGELKTCLDTVAQECMHKVFPSALYRHHQLLQKATSMIRQNYHQKLTQNMVANAVFLSPSYFSKVFKDAFGCTFNQYLNHVRIDKAKELLRYSVVSIDSIPTMVGFENRSYFGKIFKQLTGTTPKQYRNRTSW